MSTTYSTGKPGQPAVQARFRHRNRVRRRAQRAERRHHRLISGRKTSRNAARIQAERPIATWLTMAEPARPNVKYPKIDFQNISYYSAPEAEETEEHGRGRPELLARSRKLGVPMNERRGARGVAVDVIFDSCRSPPPTSRSRRVASFSVRFSEAGARHPELVRKYNGQRGPDGRQFSTRRSIPRCSPTALSASSPRRQMPMELSTYFRINTRIRSVRAHADRREKAPRCPTSKAARRPSSTPTS